MGIQRNLFNSVLGKKKDRTVSIWSKIGQFTKNQGETGHGMKLTKSNRTGQEVPGEKQDGDEKYRGKNGQGRTCPGRKIIGKKVHGEKQGRPESAQVGK